MGIWNRWKRDGSPHSPGTAALLGSRGMETLPHSVGIETKGGTFTPLIRKGMPLPVRVAEIFTTAEPDQSAIKIRCFEGEKSRTARNRELGWFELAEIPPGGAGEPQMIDRGVGWHGGSSCPRRQSTRATDSGFLARKEAADVGVVAREDKHGDRQRQLNDAAIGQRQGEQRRQGERHQPGER